MATSSLPGKLPNLKPANQKPLNTLCIFCLSPASRSPSASRRPSSVATTTTRVVSIANPPPRSRARIFIAPTPLNIYLGFTSLVSAASSLLYLTSPSASLAKLGGTPSPSALVLVQVVASGEALVSYLCLEGLFSKIPESRRLVVRAIGVYNLFHMGAFWWGHKRHVRNPRGAGMLAMGLAVGTVTSLWYGVF